MTAFFQALREHEFLRLALLMGLLASVACGVVGSYVVVRRITSIAGGIAHCVLGGMGVAKYLAVVHGATIYHPMRGWIPLDPLFGATIAALLAALIIGWVSLRAREREDTVINALWAVGMAVGILFIAATPGYNEDLMSYLFGNILLITQGDVWLLGVLDALVVAAALLFYNRFLAVCFDEEFTRLRGISVEFWYLFLLALTALTVVLLVSVVGIILVIALLTLPVAIAAHGCRTLGQLMVASVVLSTLFTSVGLAVSYETNLPSGATTIVLAGGAYLFVLAIARLASTMRRAAVRG